MRSKLSEGMIVLLLVGIGCGEPTGPDGDEWSVGGKGDGLALGSTVTTAGEPFGPVVAFNARAGIAVIDHAGPVTPGTELQWHGQSAAQSPSEGDIASTEHGLLVTAGTLVVLNIATWYLIYTSENYRHESPIIDEISRRCPTTPDLWSELAEGIRRVCPPDPKCGQDNGRGFFQALDKLGWQTCYRDESCVSSKVLAIACPR